MPQIRVRPTLDALRVEYAQRGQKVSEVVKVVDGNRYRYARVWNPDDRSRSDIYLGPIEPKRLGGLLTEKDLLNLEKMFGEFHKTSHRYAETLDRVLEAWRAERESSTVSAHKSGARASLRSGRSSRADQS